MSDPIVVNASPLIILTRARRTDLLALVGSPVHVPESVSREVRAHLDDVGGVLDQTKWLLTVPDAPQLAVVRGWDLGAGESAVLEWAHAQPRARAIIDDYAARQLAQVLGVPVIGTLGLALVAKRHGVVNLARPLVDELIRAGLYLSRSLIDDALRLVGE